MKLVTVFTTLNLAEADLVASELEAAGFDVMLPDEYSALTLGSAGAQTSLSVASSDPAKGRAGSIRVQVPEDQAADARALLDATVAASVSTESVKTEPSGPTSPVT